MNKQEINPLIYEKLREQNIEGYFDENEAILYLLSIYYNLSAVCFKDEILRKVNLTKIVHRDYDAATNTGSINNEVKWNIPLFSNEEIEVDVNWDWVDKEYRVFFGQLRVDAKGDKNGCLVKMKKFFAAHPEVRKDDIVTAAQIYLLPFKNGVQNVKFMQRADYFISKVVEGSKMSRLEQYLEQAKEVNKVNSGNNFRTKVIT